MKLDLRQFTNDSLIGQKQTQVKDKLFKKEPVAEALDELKIACLGFYAPDIAEAERIYLHALQSMIYFLTHLEKRNPEYDLEALAYILTVIEKNSSSGIELWVDGKEGVTILHAFARAKYDCSDLLDKTAILFGPYYASMLIGRNNHGFTPLNAACRDGNVANALKLIEQAEELLDPPALELYLTQADKENSTPLNSAHKSPVLLAKLIEKMDPDEVYANVNSINNKGFTAFHNACRQGCDEAARLLLTHGATWWTQDSVGEDTPLISAASTGRLNIIELFGKETEMSSQLKEFYLLTQNKMGDNALHKAIYKNHASVVSSLLATASAWGKETLYELVTQTDVPGNTPLDQALIQKYYDRLDSCFASIAATCPENFSAITRQFFWGDDEKALISLLFQGKEILPAPLYKEWMLQPNRQGKTLSEKWQNTPLADRIKRYMTAKLGLLESSRNSDDLIKLSYQRPSRSLFFRPTGEASSSDSYIGPEAKPF